MRLDQADAKTVFAALSLAMTIAALASKAPGAWAVAACWGLAALAAHGWSKADASQGRLQSQSDAAQDAFLRGAAFEREGSEIKKGALWAIASMLCGLLCGLAALGALASKWGWGALALAPLIWALRREWQRAQISEGGP